MGQRSNNLFDHTASTQEERFVNSIHKRVARTLHKFHLLQEDDKILIALSGGKDSLALVELLAERKESLPFAIELEAVHILLPQIGYQTDTEYLVAFCNANKVPLTLIHPDFDLQKNPQKSICFRCSWTRRKEIFKTADRMGCTRIAFGHHMDDALETLMMNMIYHGSISSIPYSFQMRKGKYAIIRPLLDITDSELYRYSTIRNFRVEKTSCPFGNSSRRFAVKQVLLNLENLNKKAKINMFRSMGKICNEYLPYCSPDNKTSADGAKEDPAEI